MSGLGPLESTDQYGTKTCEAKGAKDQEQTECDIRILREADAEMKLKISGLYSRNTCVKKNGRAAG